MHTIFHDLRYSVRALLKHRNFTIAALLTLALGIGINTTSIFTLLYSVAFRPLPVKNPDRVVNVYQILDGEFSRQVEGERVHGFSGTVSLLALLIAATGIHGM